MPLPENIIILFYWTAPEGGFFSLSRNHGFADKQERTVGRSKVVRKFLYRNFLPLKV